MDALILDLDNTIYPTKSIGYEAFRPLFDSLDKFSHRFSGKTMEKIKEELWKRPMADVAKEFDFSNQMIDHYLATLSEMTFDFDIQPYADYSDLVQLGKPMYLVTTGTTRVQNEKINSLGIREDFEYILIDDPNVQPGGKRARFTDLLKWGNHSPETLLVIGDNPDAEIAAARRLGIRGLLLDRTRKSPDWTNDIISSFTDLQQII